MNAQIKFSKIMDYAFFVAIGGVFFQNGISKIYNINGVMNWMESYGVPSFLIYPSIGLELIAPIMVVLGIKRSLAALALMLFCITTAFIFHSPLNNPMQLTPFLKNIALCSGFYFILKMEWGNSKNSDIEEETEES